MFSLGYDFMMAHWVVGGARDTQAGLTLVL